MNNLLNSGEIPDLLTKDDLEAIIQSVSGQARDQKANDPYSFFVQRVRSQLHVVLAMSPVGSSLRTRMRMFPSLVNCCTINWLNPWPEEALLSVANMFLENLDFDGLTRELKGKLAEACVFVHKSVEDEAEVFYQQLRRRV